MKWYEKVYEGFLIGVGLSLAYVLVFPMFKSIIAVCSMSLP
jgi:hypothetical protein